jgi:hypothetical protein
MINLNQGHKGGTFCMTKVALAIGDGAKTGVALASTVGTGSDYCIDGILYNKSDAATNLPLTAPTVNTTLNPATQPLLSKCLYLICIDSAGTVTSVKGQHQLTADLTNGVAVLQWPELPAALCPIGAVKMTTASTATFLAGTTALDAANCTATYYDLHCVPATPLTS